MATDYQKTVKGWLKAARDAGWRVERNNAGHYRLWPKDPAQRAITLPVSGSDWRGIRNDRAKLRRAGLDV